MSKQQGKQKGGAGGVDRLRLRVSAMVNSPKARLLRQATIWRLDSDSDEAWAQVLEELRETDGLEMAESEDGTITLQWETPSDDDVAGDEMEPLPEMEVQRLHEEPVPF